MSSGSAGANASSATCDALRVAIALPAAAIVCDGLRRRARASLAGRSPRMRRSNSAASSGCWRRVTREPRLPIGFEPRAALARVPRGLHVRRNHERRLFPAEILARGRGFGRAECGAVRRRRALHVRRAVADDRLAADQRRALVLGARAPRSARRIASASCPSTFGTTCQPYASKRFGVSSVNQPRVSPSIEMPLSS